MRSSIAFVVLGFCNACTREPASREAPSAGLDSLAAATLALDTLGQLGLRDYTVDSLVRHGDTAVVWTGPRIWMATDRPTSAISLVAPARVVAIRHVMGG